MMRSLIVCKILVFLFFAIGCKGLAYRVPTEGMSPTITPNDLCIANPMAYSVCEIGRFDIVVFRPNDEQRHRYDDEKLRYAMRIVGLPNEKVEIRNNRIYINDNLLEEPFERFVDVDDPKKDFPAITVPNDEYFLLGDNRPNSEDSRYWKRPTIHKNNIFSKIVGIQKDVY